MTIFHTLKYPISDPPKLEELEALPSHIYKKWLSESYFTSDCTPYFIVRYYQERKRLGLIDCNNSDIQNLKEIISNMQED